MKYQTMIDVCFCHEHHKSSVSLGSAVMVLRLIFRDMTAAEIKEGLLSGIQFQTLTALYKAPWV